MKKEFLLIAVFICFCGLTFAQQNTLSTGGEASSTTGTVSYSVGQAAYTNNTNISASITVGVQQPYEIYVLNLKEELEEVTLIGYPNPATDMFYVELKEMGNHSYSYLLTDFQGKVLTQNIITQSLFNIDMSVYASGTYYLQIIDAKENTAKTISLIKK